LLGTPGDATTPPTPPSDKLMFETTVDRTLLFGTEPHPIVGAAGALAPSSATAPLNVINGHETNIKRSDDLQYACIFKLPQARPNCTGAGCDCDADGVDYNRPLCEGTTQVYAKAYPGVRELQVLKDFGAVGSHNSIVASICPKTLISSKTDPNYGYNPAVGALMDRIKEGLTPKCLPRQLPSDESLGNDVACSITESSPLPAGEKTCSLCDPSVGRSTPSAETLAAVLQQLKFGGHCGGAGQTPCESLCSCDIQQYEGEEQRVCLTAQAPPASITPGFCYVDPTVATDDSERQAQSALVANCPPTQKRLLRFLGNDTPTRGAITTLSCTPAPTIRP
jgi:hypothetical protein